MLHCQSIATLEGYDDIQYPDKTTAIWVFSFGQRNKSDHIKAVVNKLNMIKFEKLIIVMADSLQAHNRLLQDKSKSLDELRAEEAAKGKKYVESLQSIFKHFRINYEIKYWNDYICAPSFNSKLTELTELTQEDKSIQEWPQELISAINETRGSKLAQQTATKQEKIDQNYTKDQILQIYANYSLEEGAVFRIWQDEYGIPKEGNQPAIILYPGKINAVIKWVQNDSEIIIKDYTIKFKEKPLQEVLVKNVDSENKLEVQPEIKSENKPENKLEVQLETKSEINPENKLELPVENLINYSLLNQTKKPKNDYPVNSTPGYSTVSKDTSQDQSFSKNNNANQQLTWHLTMSLYLTYTNSELDDQQKETLVNKAQQMLAIINLSTNYNNNPAINQVKFKRSSLSSFRSSEDFTELKKKPNTHFFQSERTIKNPSYVLRKSSDNLHETKANLAIQFSDIKPEEHENQYKVFSRSHGATKSS